MIDEYTELPTHLQEFLAELDAFIEAEIRPLEQQDDNIRFFDHRREHARTDWDRDGLPDETWEALLAQARRRADQPGSTGTPCRRSMAAAAGPTLTWL